MSVVVLCYWIELEKDLFTKLRTWFGPSIDKHYPSGNQKLVKTS